MTKYLCYFLLISSLMAPLRCFALEGIDENQIMLGMSNALSGPTAQLGTKIRQGSQVYFDSLNKAGGINGRKVGMISLDDGYEPASTVINTRKLIFDHRVFALFGYVGTPTSHAIMPLLANSKIPYLMPFTGAEFLREPVLENIFNLRASYYEESKAQIDYLVKTLNITKIGLLIQADEFGLAVEQGLVKALKAHNLSPLLTTRYRRNTEDITKALQALKESQVDAVSFVGTYKPFGEFINSAYEQQFSPVYTTVSFVSSQDLFSELKYPSQVLVTEVLPDPSQCELKICQQFTAAMKNAGFEEIDHVQFEGYLNAYVFAEVALRCGKQLTPECLLAKFSHFRANLHGLEIAFSPAKHQGLNTVYYSFYQAKDRK